MLDHVGVLNWTTDRNKGSTFVHGNFGDSPKDPWIFCPKIRAWVIRAGMHCPHMNLHIRNDAQPDSDRLQYRRIRCPVDRLGLITASLLGGLEPLCTSASRDLKAT